MAKNRVLDAENEIDRLADQIVNELADRMSREPPDRAAARVELSRLLRDALPALWEWSSQESEIERLKAEIDKQHKTVDGVWQAFRPRQITGRPTHYYGYVGRSRIERNCCFRLDGFATPHRGAQAAVRCAERQAQKLNSSSNERTRVPS